MIPSCRWTGIFSFSSRLVNDLHAWPTTLTCSSGRIWNTKNTKLKTVCVCNGKQNCPFYILTPILLPHSVVEEANQWAVLDPLFNIQGTFHPQGGFFPSCSAHFPVPSVTFAHLSPPWTLEGGHYMGLPTPCLHLTVDNVPWNKCIPLPLSSCSALAPQITLPLVELQRKWYMGLWQLGSVCQYTDNTVINNQPPGTIRFSHCPHGAVGGGLAHNKLLDVLVQFLPPPPYTVGIFKCTTLECL